MATYTTLELEVEAEFIEKKSIFIGHAKPVKTEADALDYIKKVKAEHKDASHNVYAYVLKDSGIIRYSDDGEPQGTAGIPVLDVIRKSGFEDAVIVVTRYFGGILLGAGGLVRAYSAGAKVAVDKAHIVTYVSYTEFVIKCDYASYQKIQYEIPIFCAIQDNIIFEDIVTLSLAIKDEKFDFFKSKISEISAGKIIVGIKGHRFDYK